MLEDPCEISWTSPLKSPQIDIRISRRSRGTQCPNKPAPVQKRNCPGSKMEHLRSVDVSLDMFILYTYVYLLYAVYDYMC